MGNKSDRYEPVTEKVLLDDGLDTIVRLIDRVLGLDTDAPALSGDGTIIALLKALRTGIAGIAGDTPGANVGGAALAVDPGDTATVVAFTATQALRLDGFICRGLSDAQVDLKVDGDYVALGYTSRFQPASQHVLPSFYPVGIGQMVTLTVTTSNEATAAADFRGMVLAREE